MTKNIALAGRIGRLVAGLAVIGIGISYQSGWGAIGIFLLAEGLLGWCVIKHFMGEKTCKK